MTKIELEVNSDEDNFNILLRQETINRLKMFSQLFHKKWSHIIEDGINCYIDIELKKFSDGSPEVLPSRRKDYNEAK